MESKSRIVAKHLASSIVGLVAGGFATKAANKRTPLKDDGIPVLLLSCVVSFVVASKLQPTTDKIVDATFDFVIAKRQAWRNRKSK